MLALAGIMIAPLVAEDVVEATFAPSIFGPGGVQDVMWHPSGYVYAAVTAETVNGVPRTENLIRIREDGWWDPEYEPIFEGSGSASSLVLQPDGKWLVVGSFTALGGNATFNVARMNADGTVDWSFRARSEDLPNPVTCVAPTPDGGVLVGMRGFPEVEFVNGQSVERPAVVLVKLDGSGNVDPGFQAEFSHDTEEYHYDYDDVRVDCVSVLADGRILVGGNFGRVDGELQPVLARLQADGSLDAAFRPVVTGEGYDSPSYPGGSVVVVQAIQPFDAEHTLIAGTFTGVNGHAQEAIAMIDASGELDLTFRVAFESEYPYPIPSYRRTGVAKIFVDSQQRIVLLGNWDRYFGLPRPMRVDRYGREDESFRPNFGGPTCGDLLPGDGFVFGRSGAFSSNYVVQPSLARFGADGSAFPEFDLRLLKPFYPDFMEVRPGTGPVIGGTWVQEVNGKRSEGLVALTPEGQLDFSFRAVFEPKGAVAALLRLPDGRLLVGGDFETCNGVARPRLVLLSATGTVDERFDLGTGPDRNVDLLRLLPSGKILIGGRFTQIAGEPRKGVAVLDPARLGSPEGPLDPDFRPMNTESLGLHDAAGQPDGKILLVGTFSTFAGQDFPLMVRLNADGSVDGSFRPRESFVPFSPRKVAVDGMGRVYVGGSSLRADGEPSGRNLYRLGEDGLWDRTFAAPRFSSIEDIQPLKGGGLFVAGNLSGGGAGENQRVFRLTDAGAVDSRFDLGESANSAVNQVAMVAPDRLYFLGRFATVQDLARNGLAAVRLDSLLAPQIQIVPGSKDADAGEALALTLAGTGRGEDYQWFWNGRAIDNEIGDYLKLPRVSPFLAGEYSVRVSGPGGVSDDVMTLRVNGGDYASWAEGLRPADVSVREADLDGDGQTNEAEYVAGTDPRDSRSVLGLALVENGGGTSISWATEAGRMYWLESSSDLRNWSTLRGPMLGRGESGAYGYAPLDGAPERFFRIRTGTR